MLIAMTDESVLYEERGPVAIVTMNRPRYANAITAEMTYAIDNALQRAAAADGIGAVIVTGAGKHFSGGHDIGSPGRDIEQAFPRVATSWYDHEGRAGVEGTYVREDEAYLRMPLRWRDLPKPTIALVRGACVAGGLSVAWACDLIVASSDAYFADPVVALGIPGIEYFAHAIALPPRAAREFLLLGERIPAERAYQLGMVARVAPPEEVEAAAMRMAQRLAERPRFAMALAKRALSMAEDRMGLTDAMISAFGLHQLAHAHQAAISDDHIGGLTPADVAASLRNADPDDTAEPVDSD